MGDIAILYEADHDMRAIALETSLVNQATAYPVDAQPCKQAGLKTIIFWGHGDEHALCGKTADAIYRLIKEWKKLNDGLDTIEILTCNSAHWRPSTDKADRAKRHWQSQLTHMGSKEINDSFNKQIKRALKYSSHGSLKKIHVKGMPFSGQTGHKNTVSILLWDKDTSTWALIPGRTITGRSDQVMNWKKQMLIIKMKPPPLIADQAWEWYDGENLSGPLPDRLAKAIKLHAAFKKNHKFVNPKDPGPNAADGREFLAIDFSDCLAGSIHDLRNALVEIH